MKMSLWSDGLRADLQEVVELGGDAVAEAAQRISTVIVRSTTTRLLDLLSEAARDVSSVIPDGDVELRLAGDDVSFAYVAEAEPAPSSDDELGARITLRLPERLKQRVEERAARDGLSVNSWILRQLERRTTDRSGYSGRSRLHGYGTS